MSNISAALPQLRAALFTLSQCFARDELLPHAAAWDEAKHFPVDTLRRAAELGFAGIYVNEDVGGFVTDHNLRGRCRCPAGNSPTGS